MSRSSNPSRSRQFPFLNSPISFLAGVLVVVFVVAAAVMLGMPRVLPSLQHEIRILVDCVLLVAICTPFIWRLMKEGEQRNIQNARLENLRERDRVRAEAQVRYALDWREAIFNSSTSAIFICELNGKIADINLAACELVGVPKAQLLDIPIADILPDFASQSRYAGRLLKGDTLVFEGVLRKFTRSVVAVECHSRLSVIGNSTYMHISCEDISERKRSEQQHRLQAAALQSAANSIFITRCDGTIEWVNSAFTQATGYEPHEVIGENPRILKSDQHDREFYGTLWQTILAGDVWRGEIVNRHKDGSLFTEEMIITPVRSDIGEITHFVAIKKDISERKRAEAALREAEENYRGIFEENSIAIFQTSPAGRVLSANPACLRLFGYDSKDDFIVGIANVGLQLYVEPDRRVDFIRIMQEDGRVDNFEFEAYHKDGHKLWLRVNARAILDANGVLLHYLGAAEDITERKSLEAQLRQSQKLEAIGQLAGGVAHDFNNLLMIMSAYTQMMEDELAEGHHLKRHTQRVLQATEKAASLTQQLLAFSRKQVLSPQVIDVNDVVDETAKMVKRVIGENIELSFVPTKPLWAVKADPGQLTQVILNLCLNARDAMPNGGMLTIGTHNLVVDAQQAWRHPSFTTGSYTVLTVSDTGIGMTKEVQTRIFEPFFTTKAAGKGTGLGLSTVYGIVKQSGGYVWVYSEPGQGSSFKIYFPRVNDAAVELPPRPGAEVAGHGETILLVEDETDLRASIGTYLTDHGYTVLQAADGPAAVDIADCHPGPIDLLLTDVIMPKMNGPLVAAALSAKRLDMRVLFMSGYADVAITENNILSKGAPFIQKPFSLRLLSQKLNELLAG